MSTLSYAVRRFVPSNIGWFYETRITVGEAAGKERAVNIDAPIFHEWFPNISSDQKSVSIKCRYFPANGNNLSLQPIIENSRPIKKQGGDKNWRLAGDAIKGDFYGTIRTGDLMIMVFDKTTITLSWVCIRSLLGQPYRLISIKEEEIYKNILAILGLPLTRNMWIPRLEQAYQLIQEIKQIYPTAGDLLMEYQLLHEMWNYAPNDIKQILAEQNNSKYLEVENTENLNLQQYSPSTDDRRQIAMRQIKVRRGQTAFRQALRQRYGNQCMITGCNLIEVVEAAHISPYRAEEDNHPENGLLLRADLHTLFDLDLIGINPESLQVNMHPRVLAAGYEALNNQSLLCVNERPSKIALESRWTLFQMRLQA
ncbi:MAG TPA: HNH endonuclease signature motif containing protein [Nostocaceae cyanobacterium]|nr:HNH endonuclease signature motif containing protein [Nostocaceae cyanobacterium]